MFVVFFLFYQCTPFPTNNFCKTIHFLHTFKVHYRTRSYYVGIDFETMIERCVLKIKNKKNTREAKIQK